MRLALLRLAPSRRSLAAGIGILVLAAGAYAIARETAVFAIGRIDVRGGSPAVDADVQRALAPLLGKSLVGLDPGAVLHPVEALPTVVSASYDRSFPHTLSLTVVPERPVAVLRAGSAGWLVSRRGRVMRSISARAEPELPRIWLGASTPVEVGELLPRAAGGAQAQALGLAGSLRSRVASATFTGGSLVFRLRSGIELELGAPTAIRLKAAVATRALRVLPAGSRVLDVSVPERPISSSS